MTPAAMLRCMKLSASWQSMSRKLASLGQTLATQGEVRNRSPRYSRSSSRSAILAREASICAGSRAWSAASMVGWARQYGGITRFASSIISADPSSAPMRAPASA